MLPRSVAPSLFAAGHQRLSVGPEYVEIARPSVLPWLDRRTHPLILPWAQIAAVQPLTWGQGLVLVTAAGQAVTLELGTHTAAALVALQKGMTA
jgi:hypothetical protein